MDRLFEAVQKKNAVFRTMTMKAEQRIVIAEILDGKDCIVQLPTGYGTSLLYALPPLLLDEREPEVPRHTALVVSPLRSLIEDQVTQLTAMGMSVKGVTKDLGKAERDEILANPPSVILASPEAIVLPCYRTLAGTACLLVMDEAHCVSEWGLEFRKEYRRVGELASIIACPTVCLSATLTTEIKDDLMHLLALSDRSTVVLARQPDRPNVVLLHEETGGGYDQLQWLLDLVREKNVASPKTIVFAQSVNAVARLYRYLMVELDQDAFKDRCKVFGNRVIDMFHTHSDAASRLRVQQTFAKPESHIRVVVATVALGLGINIPDIRVVVHWGVPESALVYWQEVGRAGRDGHPAVAVTYTKVAGVSHGGTAKELLKTPGCTRQSILSFFLGDCVESDSNCGCSCCTNCASKCVCPEETKMLKARIAQLL